MTRFVVLIDDIIDRLARNFLFQKVFDSHIFLFSGNVNIELYNATSVVLLFATSSFLFKMKLDNVIQLYVRPSEDTRSANKWTRR